MLFWKKQSKLADSGVFTGYTDYHSHLLPGVDDGIQTLEESLAALFRLEELGIKCVWLTPHIMEDIPNTSGELRQRFQELQTAYQGKITLQLAAEYMIDNLFEERLATGDLLPVGQRRKHLLVETSCFGSPFDLYNILERIKRKGYYPLLAHPERYAYLDIKEYAGLKSRCVKFQLNLPALVGMYGKDTQKRAEYLLKQGMYDVSGTDIHALHSFAKVISSETYNSLYSCLTSKQGQAL